MDPDSKCANESSKSEVSAEPNGQAASSPVGSGSPEAAAAPGLTKEEQWALFEKELKESDWGHQPC